MPKNDQNIQKNLALMQKWAAEQMKQNAEKSCDPQLKKKYEQTAAINRIFYEQLGLKNEQDKEQSDMQKETELLMFSYFLQNALFREFSQYLTASDRIERLDEICDRQVLLCRELLDEANSRIEAENSSKNKH